MSNDHHVKDSAPPPGSRSSLLLRAERLDNVSVRLGLTTSSMALMDDAVGEHHRRYQD